MESYWIAMEKGHFGEAYNIGGTSTLTVGNVLEMLKTLATCEIPCEVDPKLLRPADVTLQIPDTKKFHQHTGWHPQYKFEDSLKNLLDYWRSKVKNI